MTEDGGLGLTRSPFGGVPDRGWPKSIDWETWCCEVAIEKLLDVAVVAL